MILGRLAQPRKTLMIHNPQLEGDPFFWPAGPIGILLMHGFTATTAEVRPLGKILLQHGYTISGPLLPGHYTTPEDLNRIHWQDWITMAEESYRRLSQECEQVVVGGESTGGLLALYLASQHPEAGAVLAYAPALRLQLSWWDLLRLRLLAPFIAYRPKANMTGETPWQGYPVNPLKGVLQLLALQRVVRPLLTKIHQPLLVVQGRKDLTVHSDVPETIRKAAQSEKKEVVWMEESAHVVILEHELPRVAEITLNFLRSALEE